MVLLSVMISSVDLLFRLTFFFKNKDTFVFMFWDQLLVQENMGGKKNVEKRKWIRNFGDVKFEK